MAATWGPVLNLPGLAVAVLLLAAYLRAVRTLRRRGGAWSSGRTGCAAGGAALLAVALCSPLAARERVLLWPLAVLDVLLVALLPLPLVLARPGELVRRLRGGRTRRLPLLLRTPLTGSLLGVALLLVLDATPVLALRVQHPAVLLVSQLLLLAAGGLFFGPLLQDDGLAYPLRAAIAFVDGLLDALPGLAVLGTGTAPAARWYASVAPLRGLSPAADGRIAGTAMVGIAELVGLPSLVVLLVQWARADTQQAQRDDAAQDLAEPPEQDGRPWWESDPGPLRDRLGR